MREQYEGMIRLVQGEICAALEEADGSWKRFLEDVWSRPSGGGGISRVLQDGNVLEKDGMNVGSCPRTPTARPRGPRRTRRSMGTRLGRCPSSLLD